MSLRATVRNGRLVVDEPTDLPEGTVLELVVDDEGDDLGPEEKAALRKAIGQSLDELDQGQHVTGEDVLATLDSRAGR